MGFLHRLLDTAHNIVLKLIAIIACRLREVIKLIFVDQKAYNVHGDDYNFSWLKRRRLETRLSALA